MNKSEEQVLVIPRSLLEKIGEFQGFSDKVENYLPDLLNPNSHYFLKRAKAEEDPSHKQLIPYCLIQSQGKYLYYTRGKAGGEARLHAKGSLGIGGHINPIDTEKASLGHEAYFTAVYRELQEELIITPTYDAGHIVGLINDESTPVGQVHLGLVHLIELDKPLVTSGEDSIANLDWKSPEELQDSLYESLETWSQICVDALF